MKSFKLYATILGDIAGKKYEYKPVDELPKKENILLHPTDSMFSDDTVMTLASARSLIHNTNIEHEYKYWGNKYAEYGFGKGFIEWCKTAPGTSNDSWANGCLMRIAPFIWANKVLELSQSVVTSHNHPESIQAAFSLYKMYYRRYKIAPQQVIPWEKFEVKALPTLDFIWGVFNATSSTKEAIQLAISCGGDTDTTASIVAELSYSHRYDLSKEDIEFVEHMLPEELLIILKKYNEL